MGRPKNKVKTIQVRGYHPITGEQQHIKRIPVTQKKLIPHIREEWKKAILQEHEKDKQGFRDISFAELATKYLVDMQDRDCTEKSIKHALSTFKNCIKLGWGEINAKEITADMLRDYIKSRKIKKNSEIEQPGKKPYYRDTGGDVAANRAQAYLKAMYEYGIKNLHVSHNPVLALGAIPATKPTQGDQCLQIDDDMISKMLDACDSQDYKDLLSLLYITAARPIEWFRAKFNDVDWNGKYIKLYSGKIRKGKLIEKKIEFSDELFKILDKRYSDWKAQKRRKLDNNSDGYIFWRKMVSAKGTLLYEGPYRSEGKLMKRINSRLGTNFKLYDIKRAAITDLVEMKDKGEMSLKDVMAITGQSDERTVNRYVISKVANKVNAMNKLGKKLKLAEAKQKVQEQQNPL